MMAAQQERKGASPVSHTYLPLRRRNKRSLIAATGLLALAGVLGITMLAGPAEAAKRKKRGVVVKTMTRNVFLGSSLAAGLGADNLDDLCDGAGQILREVDATRPPVRMRAIAAEILNKKPDLVGLQEAVAYYTQSPADGGPLQGGTTATTVKYDFLQLILNRLNKGKRRYKLVKKTNEFEFEVSANYDGVGSGCTLGSDSEIDARMQMRDAILARVKAGVRTSKPRGGNFRNQLALQLAGLIDYPVARGWEAVDVRVRGSRKLRVVNTHLEAFDSAATGNGMYNIPTNTTTQVNRGVIRATQAGEIVTGPAKARIPVILLGDLNSNVPGVQVGDDQAFRRVLAAGFKRRSTLRPPSCCTDVLTGTLAGFDHVVDHILGKPGRKIKRIRSSVTGRFRVNGLYPSDHAGVFSALRVPRQPVRRKRR
jgi:endonuclease/exonuclease/phosphatase family metal-dependent hydrolase